MGVYLVSVYAEDWFTEGEDGWGDVASALNHELRQQGLPPYESVPEETDFVRGSGQAFEEKLIPSMDGFWALCQAQLSPEDEEIACGWTLLVPFSLDETITLPVESGYSDSTVVVGAPQLLAIAERLAAAIDLPAETPEMCDNLDLTTWFRDGAAQQLATARPGPWSDDLDTAFYVALSLRAAQHSIRRGCPMAYS
ncbi:MULTISPECIES: hypothetical protein [unclassified Streptomyces]|uniref:hypothetical protein n=1 Tax=unclassified Streptomyces TaxID=2593676 RepID=UPI002DD8142C|nr:hypothetical protein [Streptomyces sp. NBC_00151]WRZ44470.1 hypothetical protein OG915_44545 [Streptomyces sp. NBC_00151]